MMSRSARSSGCMRSWCRGRPCVTRSMLWNHALLSCWCRRPMRTRPSGEVASRSSTQACRRGRSPTTSSGARSMRWFSVCSRSGIVGRSGPRSMPSGVLAQPLEGRHAVGAQQAGEDPRRAHGEACALLEPLAQGRSPDQALLHPQREVAVDLPVVPGVRGLGQHGGGEAGRVPDGQTVEHDVVVVPLQRGRRRQDHVGVPGGLVDVDVDRGHEVQGVEGLAQAPAVGRREHRVAGDRQHRVDLPLARRLDLLAHHRGGQLAAVLRDAAHPAAPQVVVPRADEPPGHEVDGRFGEQHAAGVVEVPGQDVEALDAPLGQGSEAGRGDADPAVRHAAVRRGQLAGQPAYVVGRDAADLLGDLRR